jgi:hypothetical protein
MWVMLWHRGKETFQSRSRAEDSHGLLVPVYSMPSALGTFEAILLSLMIQRFVSPIRSHKIV